MMFPSSLALVLFAILIFPLRAMSLSCAALAHITLPRGRVLSATALEPPQHLPAEFIYQTDVDVPFCRVTGELRPSWRGAGIPPIRFEVWLPPAKDWNGSFMQSGNGGYAGDVMTEGMLEGIDQHYAVAGTDDGTSPRNSTDWLRDPVRIHDWASRSVHLTAVAAKQIVAAYYGRAATKSFFDGGSKGGQEALMEAQRFPDDFDGIAAGNAGNFWTHLIASFLWNSRAMSNTPANNIPVEKLKFLHDHVLAACGTPAEIAQGFLWDPASCTYDPETLACSSAQIAGCLTAAQVHTAQAIYAGPHNPRTGEQIFPGMPRGGELGWSAAYSGGLIGFFVAPFYGIALHHDASWDWHTFDFDHDLAAADKAFAATVNATDPKLTAFFHHGGRLLLHQSWQDQLNAAPYLLQYYQVVLAANPSAHASIRIFMVPAADHVGDGPIGRPSWLATLDNWVSSGTPPAYILSKKDGHEYMLCPYPALSGLHTADFHCASEHP